jgi:hypothetical protein
MFSYFVLPFPISFKNFLQIKYNKKSNIIKQNNGMKKYKIIHPKLRKILMINLKVKIQKFKEVVTNKNR